MVVGGGAFGISAALALKARGFDVQIVDPSTIPRPEAASTDISKIVRMDYGADRLMADWMGRALPIWREWNARWGQTLYHEDGFLLLSKAPLRPGGFEHDSLQTLAGLGWKVQRIGGDTISARFPAWSGERYPDGYFNPEAGWVESGRALARMLADARAAGVLVHEGEGFERFLLEGSRVRGVATSKGSRFEGDVTVLAAGAWTPTLAPWTSEWMWPVAQPVFHLKPADPGAWRAPAFPVWAAAIAETGWYGFPANADGIVKIANHGPGRRVHADDPRVVTPDDEVRLRQFLDESLPGLAGAKLVASKTCLYSDSFDGDFWIGRDPEHPGLAVASGDSGHGFKFAPVIGETIADAIEGKATPLTARFGWRSPSARRAEDARWGMS